MLLLLCTIIFNLVFTVDTYAAAPSVIYYINTNDLNRLYSMNSDGTNVSRLSDRIIDRAWETESCIYFTVSKENTLPTASYEEEYGLFRINKDGTNEVFIRREDTSKWNYLFNDNYICYYDAKTIGGYEVGEYIDENEYADREYVLVDDNLLKSFIPVGIDNNYVYFTDKSNSPYRVNFHGYDSGYLHKAVKITKLPQFKQKNISQKAGIRVCEKGLMWKSVKGAKEYIVYVKNSKTGKYRKVIQTTDTNIRIDVPANELTSTYKVIADVSGKKKAAKLVRFEDYEKYLGNSSTLVVYNGKLYQCLDDDIKTNRKAGIYIDDMTGSKPSLLYEGDVTALFIYEDVIYFCVRREYYDYLYSMNINGDNVKCIVTNNELKVDIGQLIVTDKSIYIIGEKDIDDVDYSDSLFRYDLENETFLVIRAGEMYCPEYYSISCYADDKLIYRNNNYLCSIDRNGERQFIAKLDNSNSFNGCQFYKGKLYYNDNGLCSINTDGSGFKRHFSSDKIQWQFIIFEDTLYYVINNDEYERNVYKCNLDGTNDQIVIDENVRYIHIYDGYLYYRDNGISRQFHRFETA